MNTIKYIWANIVFILLPIVYYFILFYFDNVVFSVVIFCLWCDYCVFLLIVCTYWDENIVGKLKRRLSCFLLQFLWQINIIYFLISIKVSTNYMEYQLYIVVLNICVAGIVGLIVAGYKSYKAFKKRKNIQNQL